MPGLTAEDSAYQRQMDEMTGDALAQARAELPVDMSATFTTAKATMWLI